MAVLRNYPNVSQLSAKINGPFDCVPTSLIDGLEFLTGQHFDIDALVAAVYGSNWHGATAARAYVDFCAQHGVKLYPVDGENAALVADLHEQIQAGHPCLLTEPDVYAPAHPDWSHVLSVYAEAPGLLIARDPFSTHDVEHSDADWIKILEYREIWVMEALEEMIQPLSIDMPEVAKLFRQLDANHWEDTERGYILHDALLKDYIASGAVSLERLGRVLSNESYDGHGNAYQHYQYGGRMWEKATGKVVSLDLYAAGSPGVDPRVVTLANELATLKSQPAAPQEHALLEQFKALAKAIP